MRFFLLAFALILPCAVQSQITYSASTSTALVQYPASIPCPAPSCSSGGSLTGANYTLTPSDFNLPITRVTDNSTMSTSQEFGWSFTGGDWPNPFDITDSRFVVYTLANYAVPMQWNGATLTATKLYGSSYTLTPQPTSTVGFSYTQPYVAYAIALNGSSSPAIYSWNFTSTSVAPTGVQVVDLSSCVPALSGNGNQWNGELTVSQDDQTFSVSESTTSGQASSGAIYVIVWNRTNGCRVWNTSTGAVTGAWGTTGTIGTADEFTLHDSQTGMGGTWINVTAGTCLNNGCAASPLWKTYIWNVATLSVYPWSDDSRCGHNVTGYAYSINNCSYNSLYNESTWYRPLNTNPNVAPPTYILNTEVSGPDPYVDHTGWQMDNSTDTNPACGSTYDPPNSVTGLVVTGTYEDEILCHQTNYPSGSNVIWRFAHTYSTDQSANFESLVALGATSADGKWYLWTSDWGGMLGNNSGATNACTVGTNCRNDVFIMALPQYPPGVGGTIPAVLLQ